MCKESTNFQRYLPTYRLRRLAEYTISTLLHNYVSYHAVCVIYSDAMLQAVFIPAELLKQFRVLQSYQFNVSITRGLRNKFCHAKETQRPYHIKIRRLPRNKSCSMSTDTASKYADFFRYTSGRWLWDEEEQLLDRYKAFNVPELQRIAAESVGANLCVSMTKLGEGNYNKVFRLAMDNGLAIIARIPNPNAGPAGYTTASEVATMDLVFQAYLFLHLDFNTHIGSYNTSDTSSQSLRLELNDG